MTFLSNDQEARVRFAYRVYSTGNTYGASASTVRTALDLIDKVVDAEGVAYGITARDFSKLATEILSKTENN